ncbi:MAG: HAMP domain-containing histidine kinase [Holophagaceae bacterium]|nr:HAMP domain-containing histidine kinase [Holophagaceae bacterium]
MHLMILVFDVENRRVVFENRAVKQLLDTVGDHSYEGLNTLLMKRGMTFEDLEGDHVDGESMRVGSRLYGYTFYRSGGFVWVFLRDITERDRLEAIAGSVEQMNSLGFIFSAVRHELGNPIHSIKAAVSVLRSGLDRFPRETVAEYLESIEGELARAENLLRSLKSFSLFEQPEIKALDLASFFAQLKPLIEPDLVARGIGLEFEIDPGLPLVNADVRALHQILINLVANAADASGGEPEPLIRIRVVPGKNQVSVMVEDNGPGVPDHLKPRVFTRSSPPRSRARGWASSS